jgi:hypothetical protein
MRKNTSHNIAKFVSCILMMFALAWLTVSTPFVYASQQQVAAQKAAANGTDTKGGSNPFANTIEEKPEGGANTLSEYLHDAHEHFHYVPAPEEYSKCHSFDLYYAFHPELISPPPEA